MGWDINRPLQGTPLDEPVRTAGGILTTAAEVIVAPTEVLIQVAQGHPIDEAVSDVTQNIIDKEKADARALGHAYGALAAAENRLTINVARAVGGDQAAEITEFLIAGKSIQDQIVAAAPQILFKNGASVTPEELAESPLSTMVAGGINQAINTLQGKASPIPNGIKRLLKDFYPQEVIDGATFWIGRIAITFPEIINEYQNFMGNHDFAVTVGNIIVFSTLPSSDDTGLRWWAHEMQHVLQYHERGVYQFAIDYVRDYAGIEAEADTKASAVLSG